MKLIIIFLVPVFSLASSPFDTPKEINYNLSMFNTKKSDENKKAMKNIKVTCRYVCDKKLYKEQKIADAITFYKNELGTK